MIELYSSGQANRTANCDKHRRTRTPPSLNDVTVTILILSAGHESKTKQFRECPGRFGTLGNYAMTYMIVRRRVIHTADCVDLANSKWEVLCTWWFLIELCNAHAANCCCIYTTTLLTITQLEIHQAHSTSHFEFARSTQSAVYIHAWCASYVHVLRI